MARSDENESSKLAKLLALAGSGNSVVSEFGGKKIVREPVPITKDEPLKLELLSFIDCIKEKHAPIVSGESAKRALDLAFEITRLTQQTK
jgi:predicted dehydrogenase